MVALQVGGIGYGTTVIGTKRAFSDEVRMQIVADGGSYASVCPTIHPRAPTIQYPAPGAPVPASFTADYSAYQEGYTDPARAHINDTQNVFHHNAIQLQIDNSQDFSSPAFDQTNTTGTDLTNVPVTGLATGTYHIRARYRNTAGVDRNFDGSYNESDMYWGPWSQVTSFTTGSAPSCPNGNCDQGENCSTCPADCPTPQGQVCCSGTLYTGNCCSNSDCSPPQTCTSHVCQQSRTYSAAKSYSQPVIDGILSEFSQAIPITITNSRGTSGTYRLLWDEQALHIAAQVSDTQLNAINTLRDSGLWADDSMELFFDTGNNRSASQDDDDYKFFVNVLNTQSDSRRLQGSWNCTFASQAIPSGTVNVSGNTDSGYAIEISIPWSIWGIPAPTFSRKWGFDLSMNDRNDSGARLWTAWANLDGDTNLNNPSGWGTLLFTSRADTSQDGCIQQPEISTFIALWHQDSTAYPMRELMEGVGKWKSGSGC